jgi:two-component system OmpR family response regulator
MSFGRSIQRPFCMTRILIADTSPMMRRWIAATLSTIGSAQLAGDGLELLWRLSETGAYGLVVAQAELPGPSGLQVLATVRTAGLFTPFLIVAAVVSSSMRALIAKTAPATIIDDPLDMRALRRAAENLVGKSRADRLEPSWPPALLP